MAFDLKDAQQRDALCNLSSTRSAFHVPEKNGKSLIYFCGNSLGLQPKSSATYVKQIINEWQSLGVEGWWQGNPGWLDYNLKLKEPSAKIVGALASEIVTMNSLTVNVHLLLNSFYKPQGSKTKILIEADLFPSDQYAIQSILRQCNMDPKEHIIKIESRSDGELVDNDKIIDSVKQNRDHLAMVWWSGVNYKTGQLYDLAKIARACSEQGIILGLDLAHATGNVLLQLHDWKVDCATWCTYKYLNAGPGAVAQAFIHKQHHGKMPAMTGWWGVDPEEQFLMKDHFVPAIGADAYQVSTPNLLSMAALQASLLIIDKLDINEIVSKNQALSQYLIGGLQFIQDRISDVPIRIISPMNSKYRGAQVSVSFASRGREVFHALINHGVLVDWREPDVIRMAPTALYNTYEEVFQVVQLIEDLVK